MIVVGLLYPEPSYFLALEERRATPGTLLSVRVQVVSGFSPTALTDIYIGCHGRLLFIHGSASPVWITALTRSQLEHHTVICSSLSLMGNLFVDVAVYELGIQLPQCGQNWKRYSPLAALE
jgi:hypothetical protein